MHLLFSTKVLLSGFAAVLRSVGFVSGDVFFCTDAACQKRFSWFSDWILKVQKLEFKLEKSLEEPHRESQRRSVQIPHVVAEKMRNYFLLQPNMMPTHKHAAEKAATSDPHEEMAAQKIYERLDGSWAMKSECGTNACKKCVDPPKLNLAKI